jgi:hypothetical protein
MYGVKRTGIRFVLSNFQSGREQEASEWYNAYTSRILFPGLLVNAFRFENGDAANTDDDPRYAALYDFVTADLKAGWPSTDHHPDYPHHMFDQDARWNLLTIPVRATYKLEAESGEPADSLTGVVLLRNDGEYGAAREQWAAEALKGGLFSSVSRYSLVDGEPAPQAWLEVFETTDPDPSTVLDRARQQVGQIPAGPDGTAPFAASFRFLGSAVAPE